MPQGSILAPLLFNLYINDICECTHDAVNIGLFADDTKIWSRIETLNDIITLQDVLNNIVSWSKTWRLKFNEDKCVFMSIKRKLESSYMMGKINLNRVSSFCDLGIKIQEDLKFSKHVKKVVNKSMKMLDLLKRTLGTEVSKDCKKRCYIVYVRGILMYGSSIWYPNLKSDIKLIEFVQRYATRYICNFRDMSYYDRLCDLDLLPLAFMRDYLDLCFTLKALKGGYDIDITQLLTVKSHMRRTRLSNNGLVLSSNLKCNFEQCRNWLTHRIICLWNVLPLELRNLCYVNDSKV